MTARSTWKNFERRVAAFFNRRRTPLSGSASAHTASDTLHEALFIECKLRARLEVVQLFADVEAKALLENKIPLLALQQKNRKGGLYPAGAKWLLVCRPQDIHIISTWAKDYEGLPE